MCQYKDLPHEIKYIIDTKYNFHHIKPQGNPNKPWELRGYSGADYAKNSNTPKNVTRHISLINRVIIEWRSQSQKKSYIIFHRSWMISHHGGMLQNTICLCNFIVYYSFCWILIITHVDNIGAILLSENTLVSQHTKNIALHHHLSWEYIKDRTAKYKFLCSEENLADPFTKNLINRPFELLTARYVHLE